MSQQPSNQAEQPVQIKQRVIGAIVLVALGVIFIPMLLNSERALDDGMPVFGSNIPSKPGYIVKQSSKDKTQQSTAVIIKSPADFDTRIPVDEHTPTLKPATKNETLASFAKIDSAQKKLASKIKSNQVKTKKTTSAKTAVEKAQAAKAWAIQVGSFNDRSNAFKLRNKLRSKKFTTFVEAVKTSKGRVYRVRVGPEIRRSQADKIQKRLRNELKISGLVVAHP